MTFEAVQPGNGLGGAGTSNRWIDTPSTPGIDIPLGTTFGVPGTVADFVLNDPSSDPVNHSSLDRTYSANLSATVPEPSAVMLIAAAVVFGLGRFALQRPCRPIVRFLAPRLRMTKALIVLGVVSVFLCTQNAPAEQPAAKTEQEVVEGFARNSAAAKEEMLRSFDRALELASKNRESAEEKLNQARQIQTERDSFAKGESIPLSPIMWPYVKSYTRRLSDAAKVVASHFDAEIEKSISNKNLKRSEELAAEKQRNLKSAPLLVVDYQGTPTLRMKVQFFADGTTDMPGVTWVIEPKELLVKWPSTDVRGGLLVDRFTPSIDGKTLQGSNQFGHKKTITQRPAIGSTAHQ